MSRRKKQKNIDDDLISDIGNFDIPELDIDLFDFCPDEIAETESRYIKPKLVPMRNEQVMYSNAQKFVKNLKFAVGDRYDCIVSGSFIFGDFIEAFMTENNCRAETMTISTLSLSQENIDSLHNLIVHDYIGELNMIVSDYFYSHERHFLVPYMYDMLDIADKFQLAVAFVHCKTVQMRTVGGKHIVIHGSANLRSSGNCEQFTIEDNKELFDFYTERFEPIIQNYATIQKSVSRVKQWELMGYSKIDNTNKD